MLLRHHIIHISAHWKNILFQGNSSKTRKNFYSKKLGTDDIKTPRYSYFRSLSKYDIISRKFKQYTWSICTLKKLGADAFKTPHYSYVRSMNKFDIISGKFKQ